MRVFKRVLLLNFKSCKAAFIFISSRIKFPGPGAHVQLER